MIAVSGMGLSAVMGLADVCERVGDGYKARAAEEAGEVKQHLLADAVTAYRLAERLEPWQPAHAFQLGRAYETSLATLHPLGKEAQALGASAAESYERVVRRHPANGRAQAALAWAALQSGDVSEGRHAIQVALKLAPDYPDIRFTAASWYLIQWETLSPEERLFTADLVRRAAGEQPDRYVEAAWQYVRDPNAVRRMLPTDASVRRFLLNKLTDHQLFYERWFEQAALPALRVTPPQRGVYILAHGKLARRQDLPSQAVPAGAWTGTMNGKLSAGQTARLDLDLPAGEVVLYVPLVGQAAGGISPTVSVTLAGHSLPFHVITARDWQTSYLLVSTRGGRLPLEASLTNGTVVQENGEFVERLVHLGPVSVLTPPGASKKQGDGKS